MVTQMDRTETLTLERLDQAWVPVVALPWVSVPMGPPIEGQDSPVYGFSSQAVNPNYSLAARPAMTDPAHWQIWGSLILAREAWEMVIGDLYSDHTQAMIAAEGWLRRALHGACRPSEIRVSRLALCR